MACGWMKFEVWISDFCLFFVFYFLFSFAYLSEEERMFNIVPCIVDMYEIWNLYSHTQFVFSVFCLSYFKVKSKNQNYVFLMVWFWVLCCHIFSCLFVMNGFNVWSNFVSDSVLLHNCTWQENVSCSHLVSLDQQKLVFVCFICFLLLFGEKRRVELRRGSV